MIGEDLLTEVEEIVGLPEAHPGRLEIERIWSPFAPPWSCNINIGECGYGTGDTMLEAIEDALRDWNEHR